MTSPWYSLDARVAIWLPVTSHERVTPEVHGSLVHAHPALV